MKKELFLALLVIVGCAPAVTDNEQGSAPEALVEGLDTPWAIAFLPDGSFLFTERDDGYVSHFKNGEVQHIAQIEARFVGEGGLLGIAVHPDFEDNKYVYLYYTYDGDEATLNRVSRFTYDGSLADEEIIIDAIPGAWNHNGGRIAFGPDGKLYITTGDAAEPSLAQDLESLAGKILRANDDGSVPDDNPFPDSLVYSYGHRNPQGLAWHDGMLAAPEHGPSANDEINSITPGTNYGWPLVQCTNHEGYAAPLRCFSEFTLAPGNAAFDDAGNLYVAGLRGAQLRKFVLEDGKVVSEEALIEGRGRIREVKYHEGSLYVTTSNYDGRGVPRPGDNKILRIPV